MLEGRGYIVQFIQINLLVQGHSEHLGPRGTKLLGPVFGLGRVTGGQSVREENHHTTATLPPEIYIENTLKYTRWGTHFIFL